VPATCNALGVEERKPPSDAKFAAQRAEAVRLGGGWVYEIDGARVADPMGVVPPSAIIGAWQVAADGEIAGKFMPNPNYRPKSN
jgi:hypothetical protein